MDISQSFSLSTVQQLSNSMSQTLEKGHKFPAHSKNIFMDAYRAACRSSVDQPLGKIHRGKRSRIQIFGLIKFAPSMLVRALRGKMSDQEQLQSVREPAYRRTFQNISSSHVFFM